MEEQTEDKKRSFVNIYKDYDGSKYISDREYDSYEKATSLRDKLSTYIETVEIVRVNENQK